MSLLFALALLGGCAKESPVEPQVTDLPPNLLANEGYLYWPSIPFGGLLRSASQGRTTGGMAPASHETNQVVMGTGCLPAVRQACAGTFSSYQIWYYIDDSLWWDRSTSAAAERGYYRWETHFGKQWFPPDTGLHTIRIVLDATNRYPEAEEGDNQVSFQVRVLPPDLVAGWLEVIEWRDGYPHRVDTVRAGTPVQVVAQAFARGNYPNHRAVFEGCGGMLFDKRATLSGGTHFPGIRADTVSFTPQSAGTCEFRYRVDPDAEFFDGDRSNNTSVLSLTVTP